MPVRDRWQQLKSTLAGRIRYVGVTHYTASAYDELERVLRSETLDFVQLNYSLGEREAERRILPLARERNIAVLVNRPFAEGGVFGRVRGRTLPSWAADIRVSGVRAFDRQWDVVVEDGRVRVEAVA